MPCPRIEKCPMFPKLRLTLETWKLVYCQAESKYQECARFKTFNQGKPVNDLLLPDGSVLG